MGVHHGHRQTDPGGGDKLYDYKNGDCKQPAYPRPITVDARKACHNGYSKKEVYQLAQICGYDHKISRKPDFFYEAYITDEDARRHGNGCRKPGPGKKRGKEKESVIFHVNSHEYFKGDKEDEREKDGV